MITRQGKPLPCNGRYEQILEGQIKGRNSHGVGATIVDEHLVLTGRGDSKITIHVSAVASSEAICIYIVAQPVCLTVSGFYSRCCRFGKGNVVIYRSVGRNLEKLIIIAGKKLILAVADAHISVCNGRCEHRGRGHQQHQYHQKHSGYLANFSHTFLHIIHFFLVAEIYGWFKRTKDKAI